MLHDALFQFYQDLYDHPEKIDTTPVQDVIEQIQKLGDILYDDTEKIISDEEFIRIPKHMRKAMILAHMRQIRDSLMELMETN